MPAWYQLFGTCLFFKLLSGILFLTIFTTYNVCCWHAEYLAEQHAEYLADEHQLVHADAGYVTPAKVEFTTCIYGKIIREVAAPPDCMLKGITHIAYCSLATFKLVVYAAAFHFKCWLRRPTGGRGKNIVGKFIF